MIVEIRVKREDRKRAEALLELAGIKVYKGRGGSIQSPPSSGFTVRMSGVQMSKRRTP